MKIKRITITCLPFLLAATAFAQEEKFNVYGDYSYIQFNPSITGIQSRAFNGGGGGAQWNLLPFLAIRGDFQGYGSTQWTLTNSAPIVTPHGTIPAGTFKSNGNMFTYAFGPVVQIPVRRIRVFGDLLFGGSNTNGYSSLSSQIINAGGTITSSATQHPFTMFIGGGVDVSINHRVALRLGEFDYVLTRYTNPLTNTNNQNSFRYLGGVIIKFGGGS
jgi:hypothetical protein